MCAKGIAVVTCLAALAAAAAADDKKDGKKPDAKPTWTGTVKVEGKKSKFALAEMARVAMSDAVKTALAAVPAADAEKRVVDAELEDEHGYLVWEVEVAVRNQDGVTKVIVDAGSGKLLATAVEKEDPADGKKDAGKDAKGK